MSEEIETEELIAEPMTMEEAITVCPDIDFSLAAGEVGEDEGLEGEEMQEEVVVKTEMLEVDETGKPILPPIPFSFPGQTFDTKCQKLILNVWDFFKRVKKNPDIMDEIRTPQERAAAALHISAATIGKIGKNLKRTGKLETPGKKRKRTRPIVDSVGHTDEDVIRQIIQEMRANKITPTLPMVLSEARSRINFTGGATSFRRILQRMGYKNLSQKNVTLKTKVESKDIMFGGNQMNLKLIKKEPNSSQFQGKIINTSAVPTGMMSLPVSIVSAVGSPSSEEQTVSSGGNQLLQLGGTGGSEPLTFSQQTAAAIANAAQTHGAQTLHISDGHTTRQIQIIYASHY